MAEFVWGMIQELERNDTAVAGKKVKDQVMAGSEKLSAALAIMDAAV